MARFLNIILFGLVVVYCGLLVESALGQPKPEEIDEFLLAGRPAEAVATIRFLRQSNGEESFHYRLLDNGSLRFLTGLDIYPSYQLPQQASEEQLESALKSFVGEMGSLLAVNGEYPDPESARVTGVHTGVDGLTFIRARQFYGNLPVKYGEIRLVLHAGKLCQYSGRLHPPSLLTPVDPIYRTRDPNEVQAAAEAATGNQLVLTERYFDPNLAVVVSEFEVPEELGLRVVFDELNMSVLEIKDVSNYLNLVSKHTNKMDYPNGFGANGFTGGDIEIDVRPRNMWEKIADGTNDDKGYLDHGSSQTIGEPKVGLRWSGAYQPDGGDTYWRNTDQTVGGNFMLYNNSQDIFFQTINAYYWIHDLNVFAHHWRAAYDYLYDWRWFFPWGRQLRVIVAPDEFDPNGGNLPAQFSPSSSQPTIYLPSGSALSLDAMTHEYGHFVHYTYGFGNFYCDDNVLGCALREGLAGHNNRRYSLYRWRENANRPHDTFTTLCYDGAPLDHRHRAELQNGEYLPKADRPDIFLVFTPDCEVCFGAAPNVYQCGNVVSLVYWELAWNKIRTPYCGQEEGETILQEPITVTHEMTVFPEVTPDLLASMAYSYAIILMNDDLGMPDFFDFVQARYRLFYSDGVISADDYRRVVSVLNHHGVGSDSWIQWMFHRLPGSPLPVIYTKHAHFSESTPQLCEELILANDMEGYSGAQKVPHFTLDGLSYWHLHSGQGIRRSVYFPKKGLYKLKAVVLPVITGFPSLTWSISTPDGSGPPACRWPLDENVSGEWAWVDTHDYYCTIPQAGYRTVSLYSSNAEVNVDAILIEENPDDDGDGVLDEFDNCPMNANPAQEDSDGDGVGDACDNCPDLADSSQSDWDNDGLGSPCDNCPDTWNPDQKDSDNDGVGDACDKCPDFPGGRGDIDSDGIGDECDPDMDGDGVINEDDNCPQVYNPGQCALDCIVEIGDQWLEHFEWESYVDFIQLCSEHPDLCGHPLGCPECFFTLYESGLTPRLPDYLESLYPKVPAFLSAEMGTIRAPGFLDAAINAVQTIPLSGYVTPTLRQGVVDGFATLGLSDSGRIESELVGKVVELLNNAEMDWRSKTPVPVQVAAGQDFSGNLGGFADVQIQGIESPGTLKLGIKPGLPRGADVIKPLWPILYYDFNFTGTLAPDAQVTISFYVGGYAFDRNTADLRVLRWDGTQYEVLPVVPDPSDDRVSTASNGFGAFVLTNCGSQAAW